MLKLDELSVTSLETVQAFDSSDVLLFELDELQSASINNTQENTNLTGKGGRTIGMLKRNKAVTVTGTNGMLSLGMMAVDAGNDASEEDTTAVIRTQEYLTAVAATGDTNTEVTLTYTAVGTAGAEIGKVYVKDSNGLVTKILDQDSAAASGKFAYASATKELTFLAADVAAGASVVVYYKRHIATATIVKNLSDEYSKTVKLYVDGIAEDKCGNEYHVQFFIPRASFTGNFEIALGDSQTVHSFEANSLVNGCADGSLWQLTVFGANVADYSS